MRRVALDRRLAVAIGWLPVLAGCYTYIPITTLQPAPGTNVSLVLSDEGRMQSVRQVGPYAMRIEGELVQASSDDLVLAVSEVVDIRGTRSKWTGETISLPRTYVMTTYQKRFSRSKTALVATAVGAGIVAIIAGRNLLGFGGSGNTGNIPPDPNGQ
ncbi:MAG TPA: hypothetical protein VKC15_05995 [Gemmatimonadales bacterium]|nr:hypothetical protein [Gemmatimonadales bacterium]